MLTWPARLVLPIAWRVQAVDVLRAYLSRMLACAYACRIAVADSLWLHRCGGIAVAALLRLHYCGESVADLLRLPGPPWTSCCDSALLYSKQHKINCRSRDGRCAQPTMSDEG